LRANYKTVAEEPLPQRWIDLIHHLNERERRERERDHSQEPSKHSPH
jgi:hypothetical protein